MPHTPGPWIYRDAPYGYDIVVLDKATDRALWIAPVHTPAFASSPYYPPREEVEANTRMMTASPEFMEAASMMIAAEDSGGDMWWRGFEKLKAAFKKAGGEFPSMDRVPELEAIS